MKKILLTVLVLAIFSTVIYAQGAVENDQESSDNKSSSSFIIEDNPLSDEVTAGNNNTYNEQFQSAFKQVVDSAKNKFKSV
ncbi:MAG: hypothetical protein H8E57_09815 [Candidatus Cloacimonetes bacterium]|nr:hypothetical protein [Candidatus Cloacimonadota bacterium]